MAESSLYSPALVSEAMRHEERMARVIEGGQATNYTEATEVLIAREIIPRMSDSYRRNYIDDNSHLRRELDGLQGSMAQRRRKVVESGILRTHLTSAAGDLVGLFAGNALADSDKHELIHHAEITSQISACLDAGQLTSIYGFSRQGKTSLVYDLGQTRKQEVVYADGQTAALYSGRVEPMGSSTSARSDYDVRQIIDAYRDERGTEGFWQVLNEHVAKNGERLLVVFDEISSLQSERNPNVLPKVKKEAEEIVGLSNLDIVFVEHINDGQPVNPIMDDVQRFGVPSASTLDIYNLLRAVSLENRVSFTPDAASEIRELAGGWPSLALEISGRVIEHIATQKLGRFVYDAADVQNWETHYVKEAKMPTRTDRVRHVLSETIAALNSEQRALVELATKSPDGIATADFSPEAFEQLTGCGLIAVNSENGWATLTSKLLPRVYPSVKGRLRTS